MFDWDEDGNYECDECGDYEPAEDMTMAGDFLYCSDCAETLD